MTAAEAQLRRELFELVRAGQVGIEEARERVRAWATAEAHVARLRSGPPDWTNAASADGPAVAAAIERRVHACELAVSASLERTLRRWRAGAQASFFAVDRALVAVGLMPQDLPDSVWSFENAQEAGRAAGVTERRLSDGQGTLFPRDRAAPATAK